jgi:hypothetical protein
MMDKVQEILEKAGIKDFDDLKDYEKDTYFKLLEIAESGKITLDDIKSSIKRMREGLEFTLASEDLSKNKDIFLKARLKNYILLESVFDRPERAKEMLDQYKKGR